MTKELQYRIGLGSDTHFDWRLQDDVGQIDTVERQYADHE